MSQYQCEIEKRKRRVCFTGHRPWKVNISEPTLRAAISSSVSQAINNGYTTFISGMAQGFDIIAAEVVLGFRKTNESIHLICALPHPAFECNWDPHWRNRYNFVLSHADLIRVISPSYAPHCYQLRNEWMVQHASLVIALYRGFPSGTKNTIDYAQTHGVTVQILEFQE